MEESFTPGYEKLGPFSGPKGLVDWVAGVGIGNAVDVRGVCGRTLVAENILCGF